MTADRESTNADTVSLLCTSMYSLALALVLVDAKPCLMLSLFNRIRAGKIYIGDISAKGVKHTSGDIMSSPQSEATSHIWSIWGTYEYPRHNNA